RAVSRHQFSHARSPARWSRARSSHVRALLGVPSGFAAAAWARGALRRARHPEGALEGGRELASAVGPAATGPRMWSHGPRMPSQRAVVLAQHRFQLTAMVTARVA